MANVNDTPHIEKAIEIAIQCVSEAGPPRPKVGAVVVKKGVMVGHAYRGETGEGDHAEFALLQQKLGKENLAGATLYTTLEPCTFRRGKNKHPCTDWIKDRRIGRVVIGMLDPNQNICGRGVRKLRSAGIEVDLFPVEHMAQVEEQNIDFIRDQEALSARWEATPSIGLRLDELKLEISEAPGTHYRLKLRLAWTNLGEGLQLGPPLWEAGALGIQEHLLGYRYQLRQGNQWGKELEVVDVRQGRRVTVYIGLDPNVDPNKVAEWLEEGRLGILRIPVTTENGRTLELLERPNKLSLILPRPKSAKIP